MKKSLIKIFSLTVLLVLPSALFAETLIDPKLKSKAEKAADIGLRYLREQQAENGSWSGSVGITAIALRAFLENRRGYDESDGAFITRPVAFILSNVNEDGSISESKQYRAYNTAVALFALQATGNPEYEEIIRSGQRYLAGQQVGEEEGYEESHRFYGGIGYGGDLRPDLSNQYLALESLKATAMDPKDPVWDRALIFINRSQNRSESNDQEWAANDGGFTYMPGWSPHGGTASYGGMTHAGLISLLFAGVDRDDPRIQAAYQWIRENYTLTDNPGVADKSGLFYYYTAFAKSMYAWGEPELEDGKGVRHNWRNDLVRQLVTLQNKEGYWVNSWSGRWWEDKPDLITARSVIALNLAIAAP